MKNGLRVRVSLVSLLLLLSGCGGDFVRFSAEAKVDRFNPLQQQTRVDYIPPTVDLLWVVDNSGSMGVYQDKISSGFDSFARGYFANRKLDMRLAVITTDTWVAGVTSSTDYGPNNGACFSRLFPGIQDGPRPAIAAIDSNCLLTDDQKAAILASGTRSLSPILSTLPGEGEVNDDAWRAELARKFRLNALAGAGGSGSERAFQSLHQFLKDNEERADCKADVVTDPTCFFRKNTLRGVIFLADEHTHDILDLGAGTTPINHSEQTLSPMTDAEVEASSQVLAGAMKGRIDGFFNALDAKAEAQPNYFVVSIVNATCAESGTYCGLKTVNGVTKRDSSERWGPEYVAISDSVKADASNKAGKYSAKADINMSDYSTILNQIGVNIEEETRTVEYTVFHLSEKPLALKNLRIELVHENGDREPIPAQWITLGGDDGMELQIDTQMLQMIRPNEFGAVLEVTFTPN